MEIWKDIAKYEGQYQVSTKGRVRSLPRIVDSRRGFLYKKPGQILRTTLFSNGYCRVYLPSVDGKPRALHSVHRLVALAFIPNPENKPIINHKNGKRADNRVENLAWSTNGENQRHSYAELGRRQGTEREIIQLDRVSGKEVSRFDSFQKAADSIGLRFPANIWQCCNGLRKSCYGFKWAYANSTTKPKSK